MFLTRGGADADRHCAEDAYAAGLGDSDRYGDSKCNSNGTAGASRR